jgi:Type II CAAX prenyl endopeptidase Rce1-like
MSAQTPFFAPRPEHHRPRPLPISEEQLEHPTVKTVLKLIYNTVVRLLHDPAGMVLGSAFLVLMLWGYHGNLELLRLLWPGWHGIGSDPASRPPIIAGLPWDHEWLSFAVGFVLLVGVPAFLIKVVYRQRLRDYGLGLPRRDRWSLTLVSTFLLLGASLPVFYLGSRDPAMRAEYPLYRGSFASLGQFFLYELGYLLFFVAIEFIFRGYLLFGLFRMRDKSALPGTTGVPGPFVFGYYAIFIAMLSYTAWHLGKPIPELWGTLVWGVAAGTVALATETILPIIVVHWLLNVFLDYVICHGVSCP